MFKCETSWVCFIPCRYIIRSLVPVVLFSVHPLLSDFSEFHLYRSSSFEHERELTAFPSVGSTGKTIYLAFVVQETKQIFRERAWLFLLHRFAADLCGRFRNTSFFFTFPRILYLSLEGCSLLADILVSPIFPSAFYLPWKWEMILEFILLFNFVCYSAPSFIFLVYFNTNVLYVQKNSSFRNICFKGLFWQKVSK